MTQESCCGSDIVKTDKESSDQDINKFITDW
jgi:hypothetical protein